MDSYPLPPMAGGSLPDNARIQWTRAATVISVVALALYFLWRVKDILPPFVIAFFLASLLDPLVNRLQRHGWSRGRAVATIYLAVFLFIVAITLWVVPVALDQGQSLSQHSGELELEFKKQAADFYGRYQKQLGWFGIKQNPVTDKSGPVAKAATGFLDSVKSSVLGLAGRFIWLIIIPLSLFYFLLDYRSIRAKLISLFPEPSQPSVDRMSDEVVEIFSHYMRSLTIVCILYGLTAVVLFSILGVRYGLFLGLAAGILYAVPYVGPALAGASAGIIALTAKAPGYIPMSPTAYAILVVLVFFAMHSSFDYGITPRVVGGSVGLHPLVNIFALMAGATAFGVWGMLLAVPVAAAVQMVLIYFFPRLGEKPRMAHATLDPSPAPEEMAPHPL